MDLKPGTPLATGLFLALFAFGFAFMLSATFAVDHFHLFGLTQASGVDINAKVGLAPRLDQYGVSLHPLTPKPRPQTSNLIPQTLSYTL